MSTPARSDQPDDHGNSSPTKTVSPTKTEAKRINVAVTPDVVRAIEVVMEKEQVSLTEAVRKLIGYGDYVYRAVKEQNSEILVRNGDTLREIVLL